MPAATTRRALLGAALFAPVLGSLRAQPAAAAAGPVTLFAAASLTEALRELTTQWAAQGHAQPRLSTAASSVLARQIEQGAQADLFLSADEPWMDYLQQRGLIDAATRLSPIGNRLVLVAPAGSGPTVDLRPGVNLAALLGAKGRLATGDPAHVPAGRYAQAALQRLGLWDGLAPRLARAENVRSALMLVERGEAPLGIVYATDAAASRGVRVVGAFPATSHPPISYPFAVTRRAQANAQARSLHAFLASAAAHVVWQRHGFAALG